MESNEHSSVCIKVTNIHLHLKDMTQALPFIASFYMKAISDWLFCKFKLIFARFFMGCRTRILLPFTKHSVHDFLWLCCSRKKQGSLLFIHTWHRCSINDYQGCPRASQVVLMVKNPPANAGDLRDPNAIPGLGRSPGGENGNPLQYSCLENSMDQEPGGLKSWAWLKQLNNHTGWSEGNSENVNPDHHGSR